MNFETTENTTEIIDAIRRVAHIINKTKPLEEFPGQLQEELILIKEIHSKELESLQENFIEDKKTLQDKIEVLLSKVDELKAQNQDYSNEIKDLRAQIQSDSEESLKIVHQNEVLRDNEAHFEQILQNEHNRLQEKLKRSKEKNMGVIANQNIAIQSYKSKISNLESEILRIKEFEDLYAGFSEKYDTLEHQYYTLIHEKEDLEQ